MMASFPPPVRRARCDYPGCSRSYLRAEHLNRHRLTHETSAFQCCLCTKQFSRNDLLHAHLKRHEKRGKPGAAMRETGRRAVAATPEDGTVKQGSPPPTPHQQKPVRQTYTPVAVPISISSLPPVYEAMDRGWAPGIDTSRMRYDVNSMNEQHTAVMQAQFSGAPMDGVVSAQQQMMHAGWAAVGNGVGATGAEFPWPFQDGGIFGMAAETYPELTPGGEFLDPFMEEYGPVVEQGIGFCDDVAQQLNMEKVGEDCSMAPGVYERIAAEFPNLPNLYLGDRVSLFQLYSNGLDYADICMPFFHHPTLDLEVMPSLLILAICGLGACISDDEGKCETGQAIHTHVWRQTFLAAMDARQVDIWTLQTMVVLEHIGFYALSRSAHEKADVFHSMVVTLARRSSLLAQNFDSSNGSRQSPQKRWEEWAERETIIRVAYSIFILDVDLRIHFMHPALITLGMVKLPLPSPPSLWHAKTAAEWSRQTENSRPPPRTSSLRTLRSALEIFIPVHCTYSRPRRRVALHLFCSSAFTLQILIHGLTTAIFEVKFRGIDSGCSPGLQVLQLRDFEEGLAGWMACFERLAPDTASTELARSSLVTYHFASILLRESLSDIQMAAGTAYSWGRAVTPQRAQDAFLPLVSTRPVKQESYRHALKVLSLCLDNNDSTADADRGPKALHPLHLTYNTFIAVLVVWAYALGLSRLQGAKGNGGVQPAQALWVVEDGKLKLADASGDRGPEGSEAAALGGVLERGFARPQIAAEEIEKIRGDVRKAMGIVRRRLEGSSWELSYEAMRVLDSLLDKNGFME